MTTTPIERHEPGLRMSQAVVHGDTVYLAGIVAERSKGAVTEQAQEILSRIDKLLAAAGSSKVKLLSAQIWLADMADYDAFNAVWDSWIDPGNLPARACINARLVRPEWRVEVMVVAAR
jgi:enamine deaminase RidA (YjgF/YER057c/UK114 family)